jgi:MFS family permease
MVYTPLDLRATAGQMYATAANVAWTIVARRLGEAVAFGVAFTDITAHRAYRDQWRVARCGFYAFGMTTISSFISPFVAGQRALRVAGVLGIVAGPLRGSRMLKRYLFSVAFFTILIGVIYLLLGVAPLVVFLTVVVSLSGFLTAVLLLKRRLDVSTEKALETAAPGYFTNLATQKLFAEALLVGDFWAVASAVASILLLAFFMPYSLAKFIIQHQTKTQ